MTDLPRNVTFVTSPAYGLPSRPRTYDSLLLGMSGLQAYWPTDDPVGSSALRELVSGNAATLSGAYTLQSSGPLRAKPTGAVAFTAGAAVASVNPAPQGAGARSGVFWAKTTSTGIIVPWSYGSASTRAIFEPLMGSPGAGQWSANLYNENDPFIATGNDGAWHFIALTYDGGTGLGLSIDAGAFQSITSAGALVTGSSSFTIGKDGPQNTFSWPGSLAAIAIFNRVVTSSELSTLYLRATL